MKKDARERRWMKQERFLEGTVSVKEVLNYVESDRFMDLAGAARFLPFCEKTIRAHLDEIPHFRVGGKFVFRKSELIRWMDGFRRKEPDLDTAMEIAEKLLGRKAKT